MNCYFRGHANGCSYQKEAKFEEDLRLAPVNEYEQATPKHLMSLLDEDLNELIVSVEQEIASRQPKVYSSAKRKR